MVVEYTLSAPLISYKKDTSCRTFTRITCEEKQLQNGINIFTREKATCRNSQTFPVLYDKATLWDNNSFSSSAQE